MGSRVYPLAFLIPTHNRVDALQQCLAHLESQEWKDFEVVVVDDGSTDSTAGFLRSYALQTPLAFRYELQEYGGPARTRNRAIAMIESPICLMIGDDIFASPGFAEKHLELHRQRPEPAVAGLGLTRWSDIGQTVTPFMRWMDTDGMQFEYGRLLEGQKPDWRHFYTSNLSVKTEVLKEFPFDESFPAALEDIELGCRIEERHGLDLVFLPEALADHLHPKNYFQSCDRMIRVGEAAVYFDTIWPGKFPERGGSLKRALRKTVLVAPFALPLWVRLANLSLHIACPNPLMKFVLGCHFDSGYNRARLQRTSSPRLPG